MNVNGFARAGALAMVLLGAGAGSASAADPSYQVGKTTLLPRVALDQRAASGGSCIRTPLSSALADVRTLTAPATGYLNVRLQGSGTGPDWDLAVFNAVTGERIGGSAAFGDNEVVTSVVTAGTLLEVQACHISGDGAAPALSITEGVVSGTIPKPETESFVKIRFRGRSDIDKLQALGIDLAESAKEPTIGAVLHSAADAAKLKAAGFTYDTAVKDLAAQDRKVLFAGAMAKRTGTADQAVGSRALTSGRTTYRELADYETDLKALVTAHPDEVRPVILGTSLEGRTIEGIEMATDVSATDDGRPTHVELGLHHVREWPSGEVTMEYAIDLMKGYTTGDAEFTKLMTGERTFIFPVINPDGLVATFAPGAGPNPTIDDDTDGGLSATALGLAGEGAYRRKNCRDTTGAGLEGIQPCSLSLGVDLNRNYGAFWGGPGESDNPAMQDYRGTAPYSEPESAAVHAWSIKHQIMVLNSNHTTAADVLYQPGFNATDEPGLPKGTKVPYEDAMATVGADMAKPAGFVAEVSYKLYDVTGATEDTNYYEQGTFGYTTEEGFYDFHPNYQDGVIDQYTGARDGTLDKAAIVDHPVSQGGVRQLMVVAGEAALDPAYHSTLTGTVPAGRTLRLTKDFETSTSYVITQTDTVALAGDAMLLPTHLETSLTVPASGHFSWAINPSTRPVPLIAGKTEAWKLDCLDGTTVEESHDVTIAIGQTINMDMLCGSTPDTGTTTTPPTTTTTTETTPTTPASTTTTPETTTTTPGTTATTPGGTTTVPGQTTVVPGKAVPPTAGSYTLKAADAARTRAYAKSGRRVKVALTMTGKGPLTSVVGVLKRGGTVVAGGKRARLTVKGLLILQAPVRLKAGSYKLTVTAKTPDGRAVKATLSFKLGQPAKDA